MYPLQHGQDGHATGEFPIGSHFVNMTAGIVTLRNTDGSTVKAPATCCPTPTGTLSPLRRYVYNRHVRCQ